MVLGAQLNQPWVGRVSLEETEKHTEIRHGGYTAGRRRRKHETTFERGRLLLDFRIGFAPEATRTHTLSR